MEITVLGLLGFAAGVGAVAVAGELASPDVPASQSGALWTALAALGVLALVLVMVTAVDVFHAWSAAADRLHDVHAPAITWGF